ncbi:vanadium-dependent haloperoxidase [Jannaschia sp. R86511]|uniref:vanadium-dependent haloperoxidase n=1 Tax=Jannaschia sp. R86511 TaxID=3093853 RepID=UPI0036D3046A
MTAPSRRQVLRAAAAVGAVGAAGAVGAVAVGRDPVDVVAEAVGRGRTGGGGAAPADELPAGAALRWLDSYLGVVEAAGTPPPVVAEMLAELGVVLHAACSGRDDPPLRELGEGALRELDLPRPDAGADPAAVVDAAFERLVPRRYVDATGPALVSAVRAARTRLDALPPRTRGRAEQVGQRLADAVHAWYLQVLLPGQLTPVPRAVPAGPGTWRSTPPDHEQAVLPYWGSSRTLVLADPQQVQPPPPPPFSAAPGSRFRQQAEEVVRTVADLDGDQEAAARHWADGKWSVTPPGHWARLAGTHLADDDADLRTAARTLLRLGLSQHDSFVSCWWSKYHHDVMRPVTYVQEVMGERDWLPPVVTPCFPEYTSGHATQSAAAATVLTVELGDRAFTDRTVAHLPARRFPSYRAAAEEAAASRLFGGIHFRDSNEAGLLVGAEVGRQVADLPLLG